VAVTAAAVAVATVVAAVAEATAAAVETVGNLLANAIKIFNKKVLEFASGLFLFWYFDDSLPKHIHPMLGILADVYIKEVIVSDVVVLAAKEETTWEFWFVHP